MTRVEKWREKCYAGVPARLYKDLQNFRTLYPYKNLTISGRTWRYIDAPGGSEVILMLPGSLSSGESNWREIPRFLPEYRVLSPGYPSVESPEMLIEGIRTILEKENIEKVHVIGASMGGALAHWFIRRYPRMVGRMVLFSLGMPNEASAKALHGAVRTFSLFPGFLLRRMMGRAGARLVAPLPEDQALLMAAYFRDLYRNDMDKRTMIAHLRLTADMAVRVTEFGLDRPLESGHPVLIVNSADDETFSREEQNALLSLYPGAGTHLFPSGGHTMFSRREELWTLICDFIRE